MSGGRRRSLAGFACRVLDAMLPPSLQPWARAIRCEAASIPDDTSALLFTLQSLCGLMPRAIAWHVLRLFASPARDGTPFFGASITMDIHEALLSRPRALGIACAIGAVSLGLAHLALAGAPTRYLGINLGALGIGLALLALLGQFATADRRWTGGAMVAIAGALLATALLGARADGAARWVHLGGLAVQPSLILLPVMLVAFARSRDLLTAFGIIAASVAMALQPDRGMAGMLVLSLATLALFQRDRYVTGALAAGTAAFAATLARADRLPAVLHVDQIFYSSFDVHPVAGMAVLGGSALLLVPAIVGWHRDPENRATYAAFGAVWSAAIAAAALGNYPTPIVGYGGSAIIGYVLSVLALPPAAEVRAGVTSCTGGKTVATQTDLRGGERDALRRLYLPAGARRGGQGRRHLRPGFGG